MKKGMLCFLAATTMLAGSYGASAESLNEALAAAYESNPQLLAQRAALRAIDENVSSAKSGFLPNLSGTYTYVDGDQTRTEAGSDPTKSAFSSKTFSASAQQSIFNGFQDRNAVKQAKSQVMAGRAQLQSVEQSVLLNAVTAYMNVVRDEAVVELNNNNIQVLERELQASRDRFRVGEVTRTDVAQSEARLESAKSQLLAAEATLASSRALYLRVIGRPPATLETPAAMPALPETLDSAVEMAMEKSPGVIAARYTEEAARRNVDKAKGALSPTLGARASWSREDGSSTVGSFIRPDAVTESSSIAVQLSVPFYAGGARHSAVRQAKQVRSQRLMEIRQAERVAQENALVAWDNYRAAKGQILATEASVRANEIALEGVRQEAAVGSRTTLDVLNAEQESLNARVALVRAQRDEFVAAYSLLASVGKLTARDIALGVETYDENAYYDKVDDKFFGLDTKVD